MVGSGAGIPVPSRPTAWRGCCQSLMYSAVIVIYFVMPFRVSRQTVATRSRPDRSRPRTPRHNSDANKTWQYSTHKKTAGAVVRVCSQRVENPGTRFMRCSGNVTRLNERWQAVFVLRAEVCIIAAQKWNAPKDSGVY